MVIAGRVSYGGTAHADSLQYFNYQVGVFDTLTFDPDNLEPEYGTDGENIAWDPYFRFEEFDDSLVAGTYYIGSFMDVNFNEQYDPEIDPAAFYGVGDEMTPVTVEHGQDALDIHIILEDPEVLMPHINSTGIWSKPKTSGASKRPELYKAISYIKRALKEQSK
jgi:hypothetical protein